MNAVEIELQRARNTFETFKKLQDRAEYIAESIALQQTSFCSDPATLCDNNEQFVNEESELKRRLLECRQQLAAEFSTADALSAQHSQFQQRLASTQAELKVTSEHRNEVQHSLGERRVSLPGNWQVMAEGICEQDLQNLEDEWQLLLQQGLEARYNALLQAEANADSFGNTVAQLEYRCNALPVDACQPVSEIDRLIAVAKNHQSASDKALQELRLEADRLTQRQSQRRQLCEDYQCASKEHGLYEILAELLGPRKLQRVLVRRAESEIVELANSMLDRISGGQLELTLANPEEHDGECLSKNVLQLEARNRSTASEPLGVALLSGSQRFRVSVSLALGMGQYASARRRSIQSVIIDEGFGSLDREGRQVMIQELQNLRGHLERIVLVSHQEEFADAFPDGYRFELIDGATQVTRFHR